MRTKEVYLFKDKRNEALESGRAPWFTQGAMKKTLMLTEKKLGANR